MPVVFLNVVDPVGAGLVRRWSGRAAASPAFCQTEFGASTQWPEILKRIAPNLMRVAIIHDPDVRPNQNQIAAIQTVAPASASKRSASMPRTSASWSAPSRDFPARPMAV